MGKILLVVSDKGGVGKSTYVANTGSMLVNKGKSVIILKTDKNHDLLSWNEKRTDNGLLTIPVHAAYGNVSNEIKRLSKLCEVLIVDCPGHDSQEFRSALTVSDIVVTLVKPSSDFESETLTSVTEKIRTAQKANAALGTVGAVHQNQLSETPATEKRPLIWINYCVRTTSGFNLLKPGYPSWMCMKAPVMKGQGYMTLAGHQAFQQRKHRLN
ncbi:hypothetical protein MY011_47130 [Escherichia coli]|uniref:nucleotide-binding protein n=1 Tax=Escherichia coli TaxID=562 RepID=UPI0019F4A985|nr:hypothetical protein MY011_47130 [Escherichia coli]